MELYLIRHTTPEIRAGICYGHSDINVARTFQQEAEIIQQKLLALNPAAIYTSPSRRCTKLAEALSIHWNCRPPIEDRRLMELHFGEWEMKAWDEISLEELERWGAGYIHHPPPGGETFHNLHQRASAFLSELRSTDTGSAAVVTHAGVIRALLAEAMCLPLNETFKFELGYGGVTHLACNGADMQVMSIDG